MVIDSKYTRTFISNNMTRLKYDELYAFAVSLRNHKNTVSRYVCDNLLQYLEYNNFQFIKEMRALYKNTIHSSFDKQLYQQIIDAYQNKFDALQRRLQFERVEYNGVELYKRDGKNYKKGDFKKTLLTYSSTSLSICLTYLARYGNEKTLDYINEQIKKCDGKKKNFYKNILDKCNKFGFERLLNLSLRKRQRVLKRYADKPIEFKSLAFSGRSRKKDIVSYNSHFGSIINAFVSLSGMTRKSFDIPIKFSKDWFGNILIYHKENPDYEYVLCFDEKHKQVKVNIVKNGTRYIPTVTEQDDVIGIDVNVKHNLFSLSNEIDYDYDRKLVTDYCKLKRHLDGLKSNDKNYQTGRRYQFKLNALRNKMLNSNQQLISNLCKDLQKQGIRHIAMENLDNGFGKSFVKDKSLEGINFNDIVKFLGISSLKQEIEHIARKYDIAVSTVHSCYTSKMCPICGCIEEENRQTQEIFECIECHHSNNADVNASVNIRNRVSIAVLRKPLLKQLDNGAYEPKSLKREKVKDVLLSFRRTLLKMASECG